MTWRPWLEREPGRPGGSRSLAHVSHTVSFPFSPLLPGDYVLAAPEGNKGFKASPEASMLVAKVGERSCITVSDSYCNRLPRT